jgi:hypothetical protein
MKKAKAMRIRTGAKAGVIMPSMPRAPYQSS